MQLAGAVLLAGESSRVMLASARLSCLRYNEQTLALAFVSTSASSGVGGLVVGSLGLQVHVGLILGKRRR